MKFLCKLFGIDYVSFLTKKSENVFNVFTKTVKKLESLNDSIGIHRDEKAEAIKAAQAAHVALVNRMEANTKMITKLNEFTKP